MALPLKQCCQMVVGQEATLGREERVGANWASGEEGPRIQCCQGPVGWQVAALHSPPAHRWRVPGC